MICGLSCISDHLEHLAGQICCTRWKNSGEASSGLLLVAGCGSALPIMLPTIHPRPLHSKQSKTWALQAIPMPVWTRPRSTQQPSWACTQKCNTPSAQSAARGIRLTGIFSAFSSRRQKYKEISGILILSDLCIIKFKVAQAFFFGMLLCCDLYKIFFTNTSWSKWLPKKMWR